MQECLQELIKDETKFLNEVNKAEVLTNENHTISSTSYPYSLSLRIKSFEDESQQNKFIKSCEALIRKSVEYKLWKDYLEEVLSIRTCSISLEKNDECGIEIHHHVPTLYQIVKAIVNKRIEEDKPFCSFDIAIEVIELHFRMKLGIVPLITSLHQKHHNGFLLIPSNLLVGNYKEFLEEYSLFLDETDLDTINSKLAVNRNNCTWTKDNYPGTKE